MRVQTPETHLEIGGGDIPHYRVEDSGSVVAVLVISDAGYEHGLGFGLVLGEPDRGSTQLCCLDGDGAGLVTL